MSDRVLLADLLNRGITLRAGEAVAIVQGLIHDSTATPSRPPFGPPAPDNIYLADDGSVSCCACEVTPAVFEAGILLQSILPPGTPRVPGGLRYTIARALLDVDAPPFDSIQELSQTLARYETGERTDVVRRLVARARVDVAALHVARSAAVDVERRQTMPSPTELRRALRQADEQLYEHRRGTDTAVAPPPRSGRRVSAIAAGLAAGLALIASGETMYLTRARRATPPASQPPVSRPAPPVAAALPRSLVAPPLSEQLRVPASNATRLHAPRRAPGGSARRAAKSAGADRTPTEDHIGLPQPGTLVAALDVQHRPVFSPAFASNGSAVFFHSGRTDRATALMSASGAPDDLRVMTILDDGAKNYHVQPSPDGRRIAFDSDRNGERGVYIADRDGSHVQRISGPGYAAVPTWAPDGRRLALVRAEPENAKVWNLWLLALDTGEMRRLTHYRYGQTWSASWFSDGRRVAYTHEDELVILDVATGATRSYKSPLKGRPVRTPAVSPDGRHIIFQVYRSGAWVVDLDDGTMRCVLTDPTAEEFAWSPDGRRVAFHSRREGEWGIWVMADQG